MVAKPDKKKDSRTEAQTRKVRPGKISEKEIAESIYRPNSQKAIADETRRVASYTNLGASSKEGSEDEHARQVSIGKANRYYAKVGPTGRLFNPFGSYEEFESKSRRKSRKKPFELKEVTQRVFEFYLQFLKTKNKAWLTNAEREGIQ